jgi:hypothetical protein
MFRAIFCNHQHAIAQANITLAQLRFEGVYAKGQFTQGDLTLLQVKERVIGIFLDAMIKQVMNAGQVHALIEFHTFGHFGPQSMLSAHALSQLTAIATPDHITLIDPAFA